MDITEWERELNAYLHDNTLWAEANLEARANGLALVALLRQAARLNRNRADLSALLRQAEGLQEQIAAVNSELFQRIRQAIQQGHWRGEHLHSHLRRFSAAGALDAAALYFQPDGLDLLISGVLQLDHEPPTHQALLPGMVHYERTPTRALLALVERAPFTPTTVFYDLGSGLGEVPLLVHLLTGAQSKGVEIEAAFCHSAQRRIEALQISGVTIIHADARTVDYSDGEIFFMFTPFYGDVLQTVLARLQQQTQGRAITLCTYGPCTSVVAQQPWLAPMAGSVIHEFALTLFRS